MTLRVLALGAGALLAVGCFEAPWGAGSDPDDAGGGPGDPAGVPPAVVYVNWCEGGCTFTQGEDDATLNRSVRIQGTKTLEASRLSPEARSQVMSCLATKLAAYNISLTENDPGTAEHREVAMASNPRAAGFTTGAIAYGSLECRDVRKAVMFVFTDAAFGRVDLTCWTAAQVIGQSFGLDHAFSCPDVMSFLTDCGFDKTFTDADVPCGETGPRLCQCGGFETQNSHRLMLERAGAAR